MIAAPDTEAVALCTADVQPKLGQPGAQQAVWNCMREIDCDRLGAVRSARSWGPPGPGAYGDDSANYSREGADDDGEVDDHFPLPYPYPPAFLSRLVLRGQPSGSRGLATGRAARRARSGRRPGGQSFSRAAVAGLLGTAVDRGIALFDHHDNSLFALAVSMRCERVA